MQAPTWRVAPTQPDSDAELAASVGISTLLAALLRIRGITDASEARAHLEPRLKDLEDPTALRDMEVAAERVRLAAKRGERVVVYGDYDVDGMTGTVVLLDFLRLAGIEADWYIPNRLKEGYSFNDEAIDGILGGERPPGLVITVDHGTSSHAGITRLAEAGVDVVVTDHHEPPAELPDRAVAIVNPRRADCPSRFKSPCGAAVAFKLAWATAQAFSGQRKVSDEFRDYLVEAMGLVALATVTDVVPLRGENRILCRHGLTALSKTKRPGMKALLAAARLTGKPLKAMHLGFRIGPRLNAAGRMGIVKTAIDLLTTDDATRASSLASDLELANEERRRLERSMLEECLKDERVKSFPGGRGLCLGRPGWHVGVIGIVASRLVDRLGVPVAIVGLNGDRGRLSARAPKGFHLKNALDVTSEHLASHGGHAGAAGATVTEDAFPGFVPAFEAAVAEQAALLPSRPPLELDLDLPFRRIDGRLVEEIDRLSPFGAGNPPPLFRTQGVRVVGSPRRMGRDGDHLSLHLRSEGHSFRTLVFGVKERDRALPSANQVLDVAYRLRFDTWGDPGSVELQLEDWCPAEEPAVAESTD